MVINGCLINMDVIQQCPDLDKKKFFLKPELSQIYSFNKKKIFDYDLICLPLSLKMR